MASPPPHTHTHTHRCQTPTQSPHGSPFLRQSDSEEEPVVLFSSGEANGMTSLLLRAHTPTILFALPPQTALTVSCHRPCPVSSLSQESDTTPRLVAGTLFIPSTTCLRFQRGRIVPTSRPPVSHPTKEVETQRCDGFRMA